MLECAIHYDIGTQRIVCPQGRIVANINLVSIAHTFDMPNRSHVVAFDMDMAKKFYEEDTIKAQQVINS